jgi:hypothetical protein
MKPASRAEEDVLRIIHELQHITVSIKRLQTEIETIAKLILELNEGHNLNEQDLKSLDLSPQPGIVLKIRLKGILATKNAYLVGQQTKLREKKELLEDLIKCSACRGKGTITNIAYDRSDGKVTQIVKVELCRQCGGTGKADLGDYVINHIKLLDPELL